MMNAEQARMISSHSNMLEERREEALARINLLIRQNANYGATSVTVFIGKEDYCKETTDLRSSYWYTPLQKSHFVDDLVQTLRDYGFTVISKYNNDVESFVGLTISW